MGDGLSFLERKLGRETAEKIWWIIEKRKDKEELLEKLKRIEDERKLRIEVARILVESFY